MAPAASGHPLRPTIDDYRSSSRCWPSCPSSGRWPTCPSSGREPAQTTSIGDIHVVKWSEVGDCGVSWRKSERHGGSQMFLGTYTPKLDDKGRLTLPAKFRDALAGGLMVTKSQDH